MATLDLSADQKAQICEAFNMFDRENTGFISVKDLKVAFRALGFDPKKEEINKMLSPLKILPTGSGTVSMDQFHEMVKTKMINRDSTEEIKKAFHLFDDDSSGKISFKNLKRVAGELGETISDEELKEMIAEADLDGDNEVNEEEFYRIMKKTSLY